MKRFILLGLLLSTFAHAGNFTTIQGSSTFSTLLEPFTSTATAAGTTVLTFASNTNQIFTGSTTQNVRLPAGTALKNGRRFNVTNLSTGLVTVKDNGLNVLTTVPSNATLSFLLSDNSTANGVWNYDVAFNINSLNGVSQTLAVGTSGTDFAVSSSGSTHTFNLPDAGASARGAVTTGTQTIAGAKTLSSLATLGAGLQFTEISTPSNPSAGSLKVYAKTDDKVYKLNSSGTETEIGAGGGGGIFSGGQNLITNNSFETDTTNWTASAGTFQRETGAGNIVPPGIGSASWDPAAANDTLTANNVTVTANDGLSGRNGVVSCAVKTAATDLKLQVYDGTNVISPDASTDVIPSSSAGFVRYSANFVFPSSGTIKARFKAQSNSVIAYIDDCYLGLAEGFNAFNAIGLATSWQSCTVTGSWVTNTTYTCLERRVGDDAEYKIKVATSGAPTAATLTVTLPSGRTIDTAKLITGTTANAYLDGKVEYNDSGTPYNGRPIYSSTTAIGVAIDYDQAGSSTNYIQSALVANATNPFTFGASDFVNITVRLPIVGWSGENAYRPDQTKPPTIQKFTSGSGTYTRPAGVSFIKVRMVGGGGGGGASGTAGGGASTNGGNSTFGTSLLTANGGTGGSRASTGGAGGTASLGTGPIGTALSGAYGGPSSYSNDNLHYLPGGIGGITSLGGGTLGGFNSAGVDGVANTGAGGSGAGLSTVTGSYSGSGGGGGGYIEALISFPDPTYSYAVGAGGSGGSAGTNGYAGGNGAAGYIEVTEYYGSFPFPLLVGSVTSNSSGLIRTEYATVTPTSGASCTINSQSGTWLTGTTPNAIGDCTVTIATGMFSATPTCTITQEGAYNQATQLPGTWINSISSTSLRFVENYITATTAAVAANIVPVHIICMGPR